jgi:hypothetical protein
VNRRRIEQVFGVVALALAVAVVVGFAIYIAYADGAARTSALFAGGLVVVGVWLLLWGYLRRPPQGQDDDFLDKLLSGAGQTLLLGAVLSFGFGVGGQQLEDERAAVALRRDLAGQVRVRAEAESEGFRGSFRGVDLHGELFIGLNMSEFDLSHTNLANAVLQVTDLTNAHLYGADLTGAFLDGADLTDANLSCADLTGAHLFEADVTDADLTGADLTDANLTGAEYDAATVWPGGFEPPFQLFGTSSLLAVECV